MHPLEQKCLLMMKHSSYYYEVITVTSNWNSKLSVIFTLGCALWALRAVSVLVHSKLSYEETALK